LRNSVWVALRTLAGLSLASATAFLVAGLFAHSTLRLFVPLGFVFVLIMLAARFGLMVSVLGSLVAAVIFAHRLYLPLDGAATQQAAVRESLGWMILAAVVLSYLLFPPRTRANRSPGDGAHEHRN